MLFKSRRLPPRVMVASPSCTTIRLSSEWAFDSCRLVEMLCMNARSACVRSVCLCLRLCAVVRKGMFVFQCLMLGIYRNFQHWCMTVASGSCSSDCVALYIGFWLFQGSASTRAFSRTMAKEAVLAMSALLKASGHESPSQREGHLATLLSLLARVELSPADVGEVSQELLSDGHDFAPDEVRRIQLQPSSCSTFALSSFIFAVELRIYSDKPWRESSQRSPLGSSSEAWFLSNSCR